MKVTFFSGITQTAPKYSKDVSFFLDRIKDGASKDLVSEIRATTDKDKQNELKKKLPVVCFNGHFLNRSKKGLKKSSGLMVLDFDDDKGFESAKELKEKLSKDKHVFSAWISPRLGVKALYRIIDVDNDEHLKSVYEQVKEIYTEMDDSGKDISRACFESYDPEIFVNIDAEVFIPQIRILPHEEENIGQLTNIPLMDGDSISNRLVKWFQNKYDNKNRNSSLFKLASAFNDFGVDKSTAISYCIRYCEKDFGEKEIKLIVESAYKKTSQFGLKQFEDKTRIKRLTNLVLGGRKILEIQKEFSDIEIEKLEQEIKIIKENVKVDEFWEFNRNGEVEVNAYKFKIYLESLDYFKYYPVGGSKSFIFINKDDNFVDDVNEFQIKDKVMSSLLATNQIEVFNCVADNPRLFTQNYLSMIETADVEVIRDGKDFAMIYYNNFAVKVYFDKYEIYKYEELDCHIWKNQVIDRDFIEADHHESMFRSFVWFIAGQDVERYNTMKSVIGYLLHSYKTSANNKAIILNDEIISDDPNGGSGKGIITNALAKMKRVSVIDGKNFDFNKSFAYQTVSTDCQVLAFDDVKKNFNIEQLFSVITEGITLEYKGKDAIKLPVSQSPKVLVSTNYTLKAEGGSFLRRMFEVELSAYFGAHHSPRDEFNCMLFDDWDIQEWARFDHFMMNCLQYYLENGLVSYAHKNLKIRKLINNTSKEFVQWMGDREFGKSHRIEYKSFMNQFTTDHEDFKKWLTQRAFNNWLKLYFEHFEIDMRSIVSNGVRMYEIGKPIDKETNDEMPF